MSAAALETFLARLYVDGGLRRWFLADPEAAARAAGLVEDDVRALAAIDREGLELAVASFAQKRERRAGRPIGRIARFVARLRTR